MAEPDGTEDLQAHKGDSRVEAEYVDSGLSAGEPPVSAYSPQGQIYAAHLVGTSSVLRRPTWQRTVVRVSFAALAALLVAALLAGILG